MNTYNDNSPYFDFHEDDGTGISFEQWTDSRSVKMHRHFFYEVILIKKGSCTHLYQGLNTLLIPGDAVIVTPHSEHGISLGDTSTICLCQFMEESVKKDVLQLCMGQRQLRDDVYDRSRAEHEPRESRADLCRDRIAGDKEQYYQDSEINHDGYVANISKQGVIHLKPREYSFVESLFNSMFEERNPDEAFFALKKKAFSEVILLELYQAFQRQNSIYRVHNEKQTPLYEVILYMEDHLSEPLDFDRLASKYGFSPNHFRKLFRETTGLSPVKFLNRLRITRACEYMKRDRCTAREAAERVGFIDMNYFSRTFKQVMGCPPSKL